MMDAPVEPALLASLALVFMPLLVVRLLYESAGRISQPTGSDTSHGCAIFSAHGVETVLDLHGDITDPDLVVFFSGNQFMMVPELIRSFQSIFPRYQRVYFETLPLGILEQQIRTGSLVTGNLRIQVQPDVLTAGEQRLRLLHETEDWFDELTPYVRNRLVIMVRQGNPKQIQTWEDLAREDIRVSMPNPLMEGIGEDVLAILEKVGGEGLIKRIMRDKVASGTTFITEIHHRQTPLRILRDESDAGPAWYPEVKLQAAIGNPIEMVELPEQLNGVSTSVAGRFRDAPHIQAGKDFLVFLRSTEAQRIYEKHGFLPLEQQQSAFSG